MATHGARNGTLQLPLKLPSALAGRAGAAGGASHGEPVEAARVAHESAEAAGSVGANLQAAFSRGLEGRALAAGGQRLEAIAVLRRPSASSTRAAPSARAMRRELRRLGARAEPRPGRPGDSGVDALRRELEIAEPRHRPTDEPEIAAALFLSDKTIERTCATSSTSSG